MRRTAFVSWLVSCAVFAGCADDPTAPGSAGPVFDVVPGSEFTLLQGSAQPTSDFDSFIAGTGALLRTDHSAQANLYPESGWLSAEEYVTGGLWIRHVDRRWKVRVADKSTLFPGREMTFDDADEFVVEMAGFVSGFGIWMVDNFAGPNAGATPRDSKWTVRLFANCTLVGSFQVDPPRDETFFIGFRSDVPFTRVEFSEIPTGWAGAENDWWGAIYTTDATGTPNRAPRVEIPWEMQEGVPLAFAHDPDGDALTYSWYTMDYYTGEERSGNDSTLVFADEGEYEVYASAWDGCAWGHGGSYVLVANVAPELAAMASADLFPGETFSVTGSFSDPGADSWSATVDYGEGGPFPLPLAERAFALAHAYDTPGTYVVRVVVSDGDGGTGQGTATVKVLTLAQGSSVLEQQVQLAVSNGLPAQEAKPLLESVAAVSAALQKGNQAAALGKLNAFDNKLDALLNSRRITPQAHQALKAFSGRLRRQIGG